MRNLEKLVRLGVKGIRFYYIRDFGVGGVASVCLLKLTDPGTGVDYYARGVAFCEPGDQFVKRLGRDIALGRAIQALERQASSNPLPSDPVSPEPRSYLRMYGFRYLSAFQVLPTKLERRLMGEVTGK